MTNKNTKILVVEDEIIVALDIQEATNKMGFNCESIATSYNEVLKELDKNIPDIILMDINLENSINGIDIVKNLSEQNINIPVIYLTAYTDEKTITEAVSTNPVGYIVKPFNISELKATILLGLSKINPKNNFETEYIKIGESYYFDSTNEELFYNEMPIKLSNKERTLLSLLIEARGNIVRFTDIENHIWDEYVTNSALRTLIYRLRAKLDYKLIETVPAFGCKILLN